MDKTAIITGSNSMIGAAVVRKLIEDGFCIIAHYHQAKERINAIIRQFKDKQIYLIQADLCGDGTDRILSYIEKINKYPNLLINNAAAVYGEMTIEKMDRANLLKTFELNLFSPVMLSSKIYEKMKKKGGKIINISSIGAKYGGGTTTMHYGMSKAALDAMTINLARQGAPFKILVNSIRPGVVDTDFHSRHTPNKDMKKRIELIPLKRMGKPEEIAAMVGLLAGKYGDFITGEIISIAGGD